MNSHLLPLAVLLCIFLAPSTLYIQPVQFVSRTLRSVSTHPLPIFGSAPTATRSVAEWERPSSLWLPGSARSETVGGTAVLTQPFERVMMQQPLGNTDPANITLQMTGWERLTQLNRTLTLPAKPPASVPPDCRLFAETGFTLCGEFRNFWESNGLNLDNEREYTDAERIAFFGLPISAVSREQVAEGSNNCYLTQWFERARL